MRVTVLGAGNWGTTLANIAVRNGHATRVWTRDAERAREINEEHTNTRALAGFRLAPELSAESELDAALDGAELVIMAIPSQSFRAVSRQLGEVVRPDHVLVHGTKGLEAHTHCRMTQILMEETCVRQIGVLSGPNIAREIAEGKPAATVIATHFPRVAALTRAALSCPQLRVFDSSDVTGVELCGALKNVVAIAAGMADALDVGDNAKAFLVSRGMAELMRLASAMGADPATAAGLAGIGDLMVTCASRYSRNHRVGEALARGVPLDEALAGIGMVAEGVYASRAARELSAAYAVEMPLFEHIDRVLHESLPVPNVLARLLELPTGRDVPRVLRK